MVIPTKDTSFHWADYLTFGVVLVVTAGIGLMAAIKHRKATAEQLLTGNRKLPLVPVSLSLAVSFISAITALGIPVEAYFYGTEYWLIGLGYIPAMFITCFLIMPVIYKLKVTSGYQYLEYRFNRVIRILGSLTFAVEMLLYMAIVMYTPALALSQVTGLSVDVSILATGLICTVYTALGGIRAVVWTDAFQMLVILAGFLAILIRGTVVVGGVDIVVDRAFKGGRFTWDIDWDTDPFVRHSFWSLVVGGGTLVLSIMSSNQATLQRYISLPTLTSAKWAVVLFWFVSEIFLVLAMITGLVMYAFYYGCDPLKSGVVSKGDQMVPLFVMHTLGDFPGLPGLFVASVYSASLSTVSSGVNSLAAVTIEDFLGSWLKRFADGKKSERAQFIVTIVSAVVFGLVTIGLAYLGGLVGKTVLQIALSVFGMVGGPLLSLFLEGMFLPCVNSWGAGAGLVGSLAISFWTGIGSIVNPAERSRSSLLPLSTLMCNVTSYDVNATYTTMTSLTSYTSEAATATSASLSGVDLWYRLSYQYYAPLSVVISVAISYIVSAVTGFNINREVDERTYYDVPGFCAKGWKVKKADNTEQKTGVDSFLPETRL